MKRTPIELKAGNSKTNEIFSSPIIAGQLELKKIESMKTLFNFSFTVVYTCSYFPSILKSF